METLAPRARPLQNIRGLKEELVDPAHGQTLGQVVKRAMLLAMMTATLNLATGGETLNDRSAQQIAGNLDLAQQKELALPQRQGGLADRIKYPCHMYGKDTKILIQSNQKENAREMRISSNLCKHYVIN